MIILIDVFTNLTAAEPAMKGSADVSGLSAVCLVFATVLRVAFPSSANGLEFDNWAWSTDLVESAVELPVALAEQAVVDTVELSFFGCETCDWVRSSLRRSKSICKCNTCHVWKWLLMILTCIHHTYRISLRFADRSSIIIVLKCSSVYSRTWSYDMSQNWEKPTLPGCFNTPYLQAKLTCEHKALVGAGCISVYKCIYLSKIREMIS